MSTMSLSIREGEEEGETSESLDETRWDDDFCASSTRINKKPLANNPTQHIFKHPRPTKTARTIAKVREDDDDDDDRRVGVFPPRKLAGEGVVVLVVLVVFISSSSSSSSSSSWWLLRVLFFVRHQEKFILFSFMYYQPTFDI